MHFLNYFNRTHSEFVSGTWSFYEPIFRAEAVLIVVNALHTLFFMLVGVKSKQFHINFTRILAFLYAQHIVQDVAWLIQRTRLLAGFGNDEDVGKDDWFVLCSMVRCCCLLSALLLLPALILERSCATFFLDDYESSKRGSISSFLIICLVVCGVSLGISFHFSVWTFCHLAVVGVANAFALLGNFYINYLNHMYYKKSKESTTGYRAYSLTERFQISENIRACNMLNKIVLSMASFNIICAVSLLLDNFELSVGVRSWSILIFDISAFSYSFIVPYITLNCCPLWTQEAKSFFYQLTRRGPQSSSEVRTSVLHLKDTFGVDMTSTNKRDAAEHFVNLQRVWSVRLVDSHIG